MRKTCRYVSSPSWFGVEQSWVLCDVVVLVSGHFRQSVISLKNGQSFAKELQCLGLEKLAEKQRGWERLSKHDWELGLTLRLIQSTLILVIICLFVTEATQQLS